MKYLHAVLTVIAVCLVLITLAVTGVLPAAQANKTDRRFVSVPLNGSQAGVTPLRVKVDP